MKAKMLVINKEAFQKALKQKNLTSAMLSQKTGTGKIPHATLQAAANILGVEAEALLTSDSAPPQSEQEPKYLMADDAVLRQLVNQLYAMNAKLNTLYSIIIKLERRLQ